MSDIKEAPQISEPSEETKSRTVPPGFNGTWKDREFQKRLQSAMDKAAKSIGTNPVPDEEF